MSADREAIAPPPYPGEAGPGPQPYAGHYGQPDGGQSGGHYGQPDGGQSGQQYGGHYGQPDGGQSGQESVGHYGQPIGGQSGGHYGQPIGGQSGGYYGQPIGGQSGQESGGKDGQEYRGHYGQQNVGYSGPGYGGQYEPPSIGPTVVTTQPNVMVVRQPQSAPNNHMALAVITCLCCCWPLGLAAIIFSSQSSDSAHAGDYEGAQQKAKTSMALSIASIICGIIIIAVVVGLQLSSGSSYY